MNVSYCMVTLPAGSGVLNAVGRKNILMGINVLSVFDGMACGLVALKRAGIQVDNYYASEIDPYAMKIAKKNHPEIIHLGDVTKWQEWDLPKIHLLIGGSPCQGFSIAGEGLNFDDPRSKLFFTYVDILFLLIARNHKVQFLLENVKMKKEWQNVITDDLGLDPVEINSALVSAQNRKRLYWANWKIEQPKDKGLILADVLEDDGQVDRTKSYCLDANYFKGGNPRSYFEDGKRQLVFRNAKLQQVGVATDISGHDYLKRVYSSGGKAPTVNAHAGGNTEPKVAIDETHYRKLTPLECERLQTLPDQYSEGVSNTQRYKMIGNGWTIDVITHILKSNPNLR